MKKVREGYKMTELGEIPSEWEIKSLDEICDFKGRIGWRGYTKDDLREFGPLVIGATQISNYNRLDFANPTYLSKEKYEESPEIKVYLDDIILVKTGNTIGKVAIVDRKIGDATINPNTVLLKNIKCFNKYLYYLIASEVIQKPLKKSITVGAQPSVNQEMLKKILIPIPTEKEQEKISLILSVIDEEIDNVYELLERNKELKKGLMQKLLFNGIGHINLKKTEIGEIPKEWEIIKLSELAEIKRGASPRPINNPKWFSEQKNVGWIRISDVTKTKKYLTKTEQYLSEEGVCKSRLVKPNDLIMSICATVGKPIILKMKACIHDGFILFDNLDRDRINIDYLYYLLQKKEEEFKAMGQIGTQANLNTNLVGSTLIPLPNIKEQEKITLILSEVDKKLEEYERKKQMLEELKKGLMQQLLVGKIRVK